MSDQSVRREVSPAASPGRRAEADYRRAWWSLLLFAPCFVGAFGVGEGLVDLMGYPAGGSEAPPFWAVVVSTIPALLLFALPGFLSLHFARRARRRGKAGAMVPAVVGIGVAVAFAGLNVVSYLMVLVFG